MKGAKIQNHDKGSILSAVRVLKLDPEKVMKKCDEIEIQRLEDRIAKLSKSSKGISLKDVHKIKAFNNWVKDKGFKLDGDTLLVK